MRIEDARDAMGTTFSIVAYHEDPTRLQAAVVDAFEELQRLDGMLSNYRANSEWSEVNRSAAARPVKVPLELFDLLSGCLEYSRKSEGAFDITVGPLMKVWGFYKGTGRVPHRAEVRGALTKVGYQNIALDPEHRTVSFRKAGVEIDPGGIGKGYAVDRIVAILKERGISSALVSGGGSSIYGLGAPPDEKGWLAQIRDPRKPSKTIEEIRLTNESLSTSGSYEKFFRADGRIYSHIMDPRTGFPAEGVAAVSVVSPRTLDSEAWTKPFFINGRDWAAKHKPKGFRVFLCEDRMDKACAWLQ
jgi:thiamine biosynthesis lipoprotein